MTPSSGVISAAGFSPYTLSAVTAKRELECGAYATVLDLQHKCIGRRIHESLLFRDSKGDASYTTLHRFEE